MWILRQFLQAATVFWPPSLAVAVSAVINDGRHPPLSLPRRLQYSYFRVFPSGGNFLVYPCFLELGSHFYGHFRQAQLSKKTQVETLERQLQQTMAVSEIFTQPIA